MRILMVGAGAVGGYFGALLHQSGADITFLVRPRTYEAIREKGLIVESYKGKIAVQPKIALERDLTPSFDLIILGVKCYDLDKVFQQIRPIIASNTLLMTLQNGVDTEERLAQEFGRENIIGGVAFITSKLIEPGRIGHYKRGIITVGELDGKETARIKKIHDVLAGAKITSNITHDIMKKKWEKLCWNATFNPLSVLLDGPVSKILDSPGALDVIHQVISELIEIAKQSGVGVHPDIARETIENSQGLKDFHTSMYEDWKGGRMTENRWLNGFLYQKGLAFHIPAPMNFVLFEAVQAITDSDQKRDF
jgi:2-dehydropantoate 2-reductase